MSESVEDTIAAPPLSTQDTFAAAEGPSPGGPRRKARPLARGDVVGRYLIVSKLGAGGMGVVYAAYDPELDRKLAIKLLLADPSGASLVSEGRSRLLREAQALAKFSHPNIVAIHDVGEHEAGVWLAMEYVQGRTLSAWAEAGSRSWREILELMRGAGRGVAAAHAQGLIHRDLKPDNIMIGDDGRVRVMDFGLTRPGGSADPPASPPVAPPSAAVEVSARPTQELLSRPLTQHGSLIGTPAYMAPEQFAGGREVDAASDQFAFCVTLWELLYGQRPFEGKSVAELADAVCNARVRPPPKGKRVPGWLRRACDRGLSTDPNERWPSMDALLVELERGQARARTRNLLFAFGLGLAVLGAAVGWARLDRQARLAACAAEGAAIDERWNDQVRRRVREGLVASGQAQAQLTADKLTPWLVDYAESWRGTREEICVAATVESSDEWSEDQLDRSRWCLDERLMEFEALVDKLATADARAVRNAVPSVAGLRSVAPCRERETLARLPGPPTEGREGVREVLAELARSSALDSTGDYEASLRVARAALEHALELGWPPSIARARLQVGGGLERAGKYDESESMLEQAYFGAARAGAWDLATEAATDLALLVGYELARHDEGLRWLEHAEVMSASLADPGGLREARRLAGLASIHQGRGDYEQAMVASERALAIYEDLLDEHHPMIANAVNGLANLEFRSGSYDEAIALNERALEIRKQALGPRHPNVAMSLNNLAAIHFTRGEYERTEKLWTETLEIWEAALGPDHPNVAGAAGNLGALYLSTGEFERAKTLCERALRIYETTLGPDHPEVANTLVNQALALDGLGEYEQAIELSERGLAISEKALGPDHPDVGVSLAALAEAYMKVGEHERAEQLFRRSAEVLEGSLGPDHTQLAFALLGLAEVLLALERPAEALPVAARAVDLREKAGVQAQLLGAARFIHARALADTGAHEQAIELALLAREDLRGSEELAALDAWLTAHR